MKCPHCTIGIHDNHTLLYVGEDTEGAWGLIIRACPECRKLILQLAQGTRTMAGTGYGFRNPVDAQFIRPKTSSRSPIPTQVTDEFCSDYTEACLVLADSSKASAALSRRCLQHILREKAGVKHGKLYDEIQEVIDGGKVPSHITTTLDEVRVIGNFAAHATKSENTGEIVDVEVGEAEENLDAIEALFDFYFVQPDISRQRREAINKKLLEAGKPPLKGFAEEEPAKEE